MSSLMAGSLLGLALGVRHSLEPDHLAAIGLFVSRTKHPRRAAAVGALWGVGHTAGLLALGALVLALGGSVPTWLDNSLELFVGLMLVALGGKAVLCSRSIRVGIQVVDERARLGPFAVGLGHGIAGTGAAVLLATSTMPDTSMGVLFLGLFGAGSIAGMAAIAGAASIPIQHVAGAANACSRIVLASGLLSVAIGAWWVAGALA